MKTDFRRALARLVPVFMPDLLFRLGRDGQPVFKEFAAAIVPTEFVPGKVFGTGTMKPIDYCVELAEGRIAPPSNLDLATIQQQELAMAFRFHIPQYLTPPRRGLESARLHRDARPILPRSTRAPNSGATISAPPSRTGRRSPIRAIRSAAARASTSASCCANCCAAST